MWFVIKKEFKWFLKNPLYYIGAILVFISVYSSTSPYLNIHYFNESEKIPEVSIEFIDDVDDGYMPTTDEEKYQKGLSNLENALRNDMKVNKDEVDRIIQKINNEHLSIEEIQEYMSNNYNMKDAQMYFLDEVDLKKGTSSELNQYIKESLAKENYTSYFGRKFSDYLGVAIVIYSMILLAFLCTNDYKRDMYELLHTKPIKSWKYILGKALGGILAICFTVFIITNIFNIITVIKGNSLGFPVNIFNIWYYIITCNLPNIFYICFVYVFLASVFKTPLPAIPLLLLQFIYSNLGKTNEMGQYIYNHRPFSILVRFPGVFFSTRMEKIIFFNQSILLIIAIMFACGAIYQWNRRKLI